MKRIIVITLTILSLTSMVIIKKDSEGDEGGKSQSEQVKTALLVTLEAKPGKEAEVEKFLSDGLPVVIKEKQTITWYAIKLGKSTFGIFDTFPNEDGRNAHLSGKVAEALMAKAPELFSTAPDIKKVEIVAAKLPQSK
jgi:quinol monooxygenase YgiN